MLGQDQGAVVAGQDEQADEQHQHDMLDTADRRLDLAPPILTALKIVEIAVKRETLGFEQGLQALQAGRDSVSRAKAGGSELFIGGEMGIGNTTSATALACASLGCAVADLAGPGERGGRGAGTGAGAGAGMERCGGTEKARSR